MPRVYCLENSAKTINEEFRDKSKIAPLNFVVLCYMLSLWRVVFYSCVILFGFCSYNSWSCLKFVSKWSNSLFFIKCSILFIKFYDVLVTYNWSFELGPNSLETFTNIWTILPSKKQLLVIYPHQKFFIKELT